MTLETLEDFDFNQFPPVWVGYAVNPIKGRRKLVKVWANPPSRGNYRGEEVLNLGNIIVYRPGSWRNSTSAPGCPPLRPEDTAEWFLVVVQQSQAAK